MKVSVKTLKGNQFDIDVQPSDVVINVKKQIEQVQGTQSYPSERQVLIYKGKVVEDESSMEEIKVTENSLFVVMLSQKSSTEQKAIEVDQLPYAATTVSSSGLADAATTVSSSVIATTVSSSGIADAATTVSSSGIADAGNGASIFEDAIRELVEMRGDRFDEHTIACALRAGFRKPSRAVDFLFMCSGLEEPPEQLVVPPAPSVEPPEQLVVPPAPSVASPSVSIPAAAEYQTGPNASPLFLFPQDMETSDLAEAALDIDDDDDLPLTWQETYRSTLRGVAHNPRLRRIVRRHDADVLSDSDIEDADADADAIPEEERSEIPEEEREAILKNLEMEEREALISTQEERQAIRRIQNMGFKRRRVIEVFLAFDRNEEYAAQYLLDHPHADEDADLLHHADY